MRLSQQQREVLIGLRAGGRLVLTAMVRARLLGPDGRYITSPSVIAVNRLWQRGLLEPERTVDLLTPFRLTQAGKEVWL